MIRNDYHRPYLLVGVVMRQITRERKSAGLPSHAVDPEGVELRGVAEMPSKAVSPRLVPAGSVLAVGPNLSFNAAKLEREFCPGPRCSRAILRNCEVRFLALAMIP